MRASSPDGFQADRRRSRLPAGRRRSPGRALASSGVGVTAASRCDGAEVEIGMPAAFTAFCQVHLDIYTRYAALRVGDDGHGRILARAALGDLAMVWAEALQSPSPSALAWRLLTARITRAAADDRALYRVLPLAQADAVLLRYRLGLPEEKAAAVMGWQPGEFTTLLKSAVRTGAAA
ncbi:hypothetical protein ACWD4G_32000 [Streptomyces sp. NPDC002643]